MPEAGSPSHAGHTDHGVTADLGRSTVERAEVADRVLRRDGARLRAGALASRSLTVGRERALRVLRQLEIGGEATSLESLVSTPFNSSRFLLTPEGRRAARMDDGMIRMSCGIEPSDLLVGTSSGQWTPRAEASSR